MPLGTGRGLGKREWHVERGCEPHAELDVAQTEREREREKKETVQPQDLTKHFLP